MNIRVAVIGVGHLGQHHARIYAAMEGVELVGVVDTNRTRAEEIAAKFGTRTYVSAAELLNRVDAVSVAVPTTAHVEVAVPLLEARKAVLVEKPLAPTVADADLLIAASERSGAVLATGHTERFNPAVEAARPMINDPRFIEVHRLGTFPERSLDIDVVFDLMIHDLDIIISIVGSEVTSIEAVGVPVLTPKYDIANVRLRFASKCIANLTASRISRDRVRKLRFFQPDSYLSIDYASQEVEGWRLLRRNGERPRIEGGPISVERDEPLRRELADFVRAARARTKPLVDGEAGRKALVLASQIADKMESA
jgi:predicted dehydrogenase